MYRYKDKMQGAKKMYIYTHCSFAGMQIYCLFSCDREDICIVKLIYEIYEKNPHLLSRYTIVPENLPVRTCAEPFKIIEAITRRSLTPNILGSPFSMLSRRAFCLSWSFSSTWVRPVFTVRSVDTVKVILCFQVSEVCNNKCDNDEHVFKVMSDTFKYNKLDVHAERNSTWMSETGWPKKKKIWKNSARSFELSVVSRVNSSLCATIQKNRSGLQFCLQSKNS